jgi:hypothetical protein
VKVLLKFPPEVWFFAKSRWYKEKWGIVPFPRRSGPVGLDSAPHRQDGGLSKRDCFIRFDEVNHWLSRTRDLIANAETCCFPAFLESFRELRRESRKAEFVALVFWLMGELKFFAPYKLVLWREYATPILTYVALLTRSGC